MMEIRTLAEGELISAPGFYNIPIEVHHSQCCDGVSVTSGILRKMELATPADVFAFHAINPNRWVRPETTALRLGRAMADYVSGGMEEVSKRFQVCPEDAPRRPTAAQIKAFDEGRLTDANSKSVPFWRAMDADTRAQITTAEQKMIEDMGKVLAADPGAAAVMGGLAEITMAWFDEESGLWVLARPDTVSFDGASSDYKKVSLQGKPMTHWLLDRRIEQHGYHQQMALAAEGFEFLTGNAPTSIGLVFQSDTAPHHVVLREIDSEAISIGHFQNRRARLRFRECLDSGFWPGPGSDIGAFRMSDGFRKRILEEMQMEGTAP